MLMTDRPGHRDLALPSIPSSWHVGTSLWKRRQAVCRLDRAYWATGAVRGPL